MEKGPSRPRVIREITMSYDHIEDSLLTIFLYFVLFQVLCYDETVAEFKLCLGDRHISAQHLSKRQLKAAAKQYSSYKMPSSGQKCSIARLYGQSTHGRIKKNITAFSGKGRSLASSQNEEKPKVSRASVIW